MPLSDLLSSKSSFLKISDGEKVEVSFVGTIEKYFIDKNMKRYNEWSEGLTTRYDSEVISFVPHSGKVVKFSFGNSIKKPLVDIAKSHGNAIKVSIERNGEGKKTEYSVKFIENLKGDDLVLFDSILESLNTVNKKSEVVVDDTPF